jgi:hypothetical protein
MKNMRLHIPVLLLSLAVLFSCAENNNVQNPSPVTTPTYTFTQAVFNTATLTPTFTMTASKTATHTNTPVTTPSATSTVSVYAEIYGTVYKQIDGQVTYNPHQGAEVRLWQGSAAVDTCITDSLGEFIFTDVLPGTYDIVAVIHEVLLGTFCMLNNGPWVTLPNDHIFNSEWYVYTTKTAVTVAAGDSFSVDFRFVGY